MGRVIRSWRVQFVTFLTVVATSSALATVAVAHSLAPSLQRLGDPVAFLRQVVGEIAANQYATAWQTLDPAQQRLVARDDYVRCESLTPIPGELTSIRVLARQQEKIVVAGTTTDAVPSAAVTFRLRISDAALHASLVVTHTVHAVAAGDRWAWILPPKRLALHRSGTCLDTPTYGYHPNA
jgi:hypothetical protein